MTQFIQHMQHISCNYLSLPYCLYDHFSFHVWSAGWIPPSQKLTLTVSDFFFLTLCCNLCCFFFLVFSDNNTHKSVYFNNHPPTSAKGLTLIKEKCPFKHQIFSAIRHTQNQLPDDIQVTKVPSRKLSFFLTILGSWLHYELETPKTALSCMEKQNKYHSREYQPEKGSSTRRGLPLWTGTDSWKPFLKHTR